ncbi:MAG: hypothetical protein COT90_03415 [Candidatus Diapherotrites archaeon CG10_big_fil_rev_8_21_14_0_10_31_34]|nr:MAG: hypothetical protein COT90_03415 [Candidatus Diapherotrites archaeon CG10_big_fil_rev_8_21_14_0_10_31_34]
MDKSIIVLRPASEIYLKTHFVRQFFIKKLVSNLRKTLNSKNINLTLSGKFSGILVCETDNQIKAIPLMQKVFGIHSFSFAVPFTFNSMQDLKEIFVDFAKKTLSKGDSFALRISRNGKHDFSSQDIAVEVGQKIMDEIKGLKVNLSSPSKEIFADVIQNTVFLYSEKIPGVKGIPVGVEGKVGLIMDGKKDELVSAFLMLKRGCNIFPIIRENNSKIKANIELISQFNSFTELKSIPFSAIEQERNFLSALVLSERNEAKALKEISELQDKTGFVVFSPITFYPEQQFKEILELIK